MEFDTSSDVGCGSGEQLCVHVNETNCPQYATSVIFWFDVESCQMLKHLYPSEGGGGGLNVSYPDV